MWKIFGILLLSLFINNFAEAQSVVPAVIIGRDTVPHVLLGEVDVVARIKNPRKYARQQQRNQRMIYNVRKVFPYAKIAAAKINEIDAKDPAFNTYLTSLVEASYQNSSTSQKALTLVPEEKLQEQTTRFITLRNRKALSYLTSQGVPETNLRIETMKPELLNTYTGKNQYKINLVLAGDEQTPQE